MQPENVHLIEGDTDLIKAGRGTHGSRSMMMVSNIASRNGHAIIALALRAGAHPLETEIDGLQFADGVVLSRTTNVSLSLGDIAHALAQGPVNGVERLHAEMTFVNKRASYPSGTHIAEVDGETGEPVIVAFHAVEDAGTIIDRSVARSQAHGGIMQGVGQALSEACVYDGETGQLVTGSFMDYGLPRASESPTMNVQFHEVPSPTNPAGVKGLGENGPIGALPAVISAIADALAPLGVTDIPMPATSMRLWSLMKASSCLRCRGKRGDRAPPGP